MLFFVLFLQCSQANAFIFRDGGLAGVTTFAGSMGSAGILSFRVEDRGAALSAAAASPYGIDGLFASDVQGEVRLRAAALRVDWLHLGSTLYREDGIAAALSLGISRGRGRLAVMPVVLRREVDGCGSDAMCGVGIGGAVSIGSRVTAGVETIPIGPGRAGERTLRGAIALRFDPATISLRRTFEPERLVETCVEADVAIVHALSFHGGFRSPSAATAAGVRLDAGRISIGVIWNEHPALGRTLTCEVGRSWGREDTEDRSSSFSSGSPERSR